jgi:transcriptional regulator NrdR family protein
MKCLHCHSETHVKDSRLQKDGTIRRRRVCENGHAFNTWESTANAQSVIEARRRAKKAFRERNPDYDRRTRLRREARLEAQATGQPVQKIYQLWGVA